MGGAVPFQFDLLLNLLPEPDPPFQVNVDALTPCEAKPTPKAKPITARKFQLTEDCDSIETTCVSFVFDFILDFHAQLTVRITNL